MKILKFGCKRSDFILSPRDHKSVKEDSKKLQWFVMCRFYEPDQKPFVFKKKISAYLSLAEKKQALKVVENMMREYLDERDYNPRTQEYMVELSGFHRELPFLKALDMALENRPISNDYRKSVESYLNKVKTSAKRLNLDYLKIYDVELPHIKRIFTDAMKTNSDFNKMKKCLSPLFAELVDEGCIKVNPCTGIKAKPHITEVKKIFTPQEMADLAECIEIFYPNFVNYFHCFLMSGCRTPEILKVKKKDVDLEKREFTILLLKGGMYRYEQRPIYPNALKYWESQLSKCKSDDDYLFGANFLPNNDFKLRDSVYKWWKTNIMTPLNIDITIYALKHYFLDRLDEANKNASLSAGHRNREITALYTVGKKKREMEYLKEIEIDVY